MSNDRYLSPQLLQLLGVLLLVASAVFWAATERESVLLMSSAMSLIGLGAYAGAQDTLRNPGSQPTPPPVAHLDDDGDQVDEP